MTSGKSASIQRSARGSGRGYGRGWSPAARLSIVPTPSRSIGRRMSSSITAVRTIIGHAQERPFGMVSTIRSPRAPASRRAYGSRNKASGRSDSIGRYNATQRAVSETCWMVSDAVLTQLPGMDRPGKATGRRSRRRACPPGARRRASPNQAFTVSLSLVVASVTDLSIVVPVHNRADPLPGHLETLRQFVRARARPTELILVDDHSEPGAARVLVDFADAAAGVTLLRNPTNQGKGYSVARGMGAAQSSYRLFTDADLAYPVEEIDRIVRELETGSDLAIACRVLPESRYLMSPSFFHYLYTRHLMSRVFNRVA